MKTRLPILIAFLSGTLMIGAFFFENAVVEAMSSTALLWQSIIAGFALVLGTVSISRAHWKKIRSGHADRMFSIVLLICFAVMATAGVFAGIGSGTLFDRIFQDIQAPMMSTMFSMLAFFITSAAYRAFRARTIPALILLLTAVLVMLGRIPMGQLIIEDLPAWANWIMIVPNVAVQRGILIGAGLGGASMALRIILGIERTYMGG